MATPRASLLKRRIRQRFGISAPRVGVRSELQWHWRVLAWVLILSIAVAVALWVYDAGRRFAGYDRGETAREMGELRSQLENATAELAGSLEQARSLEGRLQVEISTIERISLQLRALQTENASLREDLALFDGLMTGPVQLPDSIKIAKVKVGPASVAGRYRYSVLLARRAGSRSAKELVGDLQFQLNIRRTSGNGMITVPGEGNVATSQFRVAVKHFYRAEGEFSIPADAEFLGGEARLILDGVVRLRHPISQ